MSDKSDLHNFQYGPWQPRLTLEDTVEFLNLALELKLNAQEKKGLLAFLRVL